jgi:hypothetical protein
MTASEALAALKRKCKILSDCFTDEELTGFLDDYKVADEPPNPLPDPYEPTYTYDIRRSIYDALTSAISALPASFSRGGVSYTSNDLMKLRAKFSAVGSVVLSRDI